jgi:glycosyltransferase involved in cell wall biosynthesis
LVACNYCNDRFSCLRVSRINIVAWDNGVGLSRDIRLLADALTQAGHTVTLSALGRGGLRKLLRPLKRLAQLFWQYLRYGPAPRYDINLMLEHIRPEYFAFARHQVLVPNPEWFLPVDLALLDKVDLVLAKTRHAEAIFVGLGKKTRYMGFTSPSCFDDGVPRRAGFFHLAGRSSNKGTQALLALWRKHPEWPKLCVLQNPRSAVPGAPAANIEHRVDYVDDAIVRELQNAYVFHLCPSETEGFGHYLVEAMSVGAVTITLDAPPMNELVNSQRGLLMPYARTAMQHLATTYYFDETGMTAAIEKALLLSATDCATLGANARAWYVENDSAFRQRITGAIANLSA